MAERIKNLSHTTHHRAGEFPKPNTKDETIISAFIGYDNSLDDHLEQFEHEADIQAQQMELNECFEFVVQLVNLFKNTVIMSELQCENDWHENLRHQLKNNKGTTGNSFLDHKAEEIALSKGLTKEQWNRLLYLTLTTGDTTEITKVSKKHLQKVHDMVSRLFESDLQTITFALINAIEKYMPKKYFTEN